MWQSGVGEWAGALRASGHQEPGICWLGKKHLTWSPHSTPAPYSAHSQACRHVEINKEEKFLCVIESPSPSPMFSGSRDVRSIPEAPEKFLRAVGALTHLLSDWFWVGENILRGDKHGRNMLKVQDNGCLVCEWWKREMRWGLAGGRGRVRPGDPRGSPWIWCTVKTLGSLGRGRWHDEGVAFEYCVWSLPAWKYWLKVQGSLERGWRQKPARCKAAILWGVTRA